MQRAAPIPLKRTTSNLILMDNIARYMLEDAIDMAAEEELRSDPHSIIEALLPDPQEEEEVEIWANRQMNRSPSDLPALRVFMPRPSPTPRIVITTEVNPHAAGVGI